MRKIFGGVLLALGGFLLVAAVLGTFWAPGVVKKTPLDVDTTTMLSGEAARLDTATGDFETRPIWATSVSKVDSEASTDDVALFTTESCAQFDTGAAKECDSNVENREQITIDTDIFATDRVTALSADSALLPVGTEPHEGLINKWPFDAEKKTYVYWDGTAGEGVDAVYDGSETINGLDTFRYKVNVIDAPIQIGDGIEGTYTDEKMIYVDPKTGTIINQVDDQQRYLADGTQVLDLQVAFTDDQVAFNVDDTESNIASLGLLTKTIPIVGFVGGVLLVVAGVLMMRGRRRDVSSAPRADRRKRVGAAG